MKDPEFLSETKKANLVVSPIDGPSDNKDSSRSLRGRAEASQQVSGDHRGDCGPKVNKPAVRDSDLSRSTTVASKSGAQSAKIFDPAVVVQPLRV